MIPKFAGRRDYLGMTQQCQIQDPMPNISPSTSA